jgi:hypothetical protein
MKASTQYALDFLGVPLTSWDSFMGKDADGRGRKVVIF